MNCGATFDEPVLSLLESRLTAEQEAQLDVPAPFTIALGVLGIAGGAIGAVLVAHQVALQPFRFLSMASLSVVAALFLGGVWAGVLALRRQEGWLWKNLLFWSAQVPVLQSTVLSYTLGSGAMVVLWIRPFEPRVGANYWVGSTFELLLGRPIAFLIGVNVLALVIAVYLLHLQRKSIKRAK